MEAYDLVELIVDTESLLSKGVKKGCKGVVINVDNKCEIVFLNAKNLGDYVYANLDKTLLKTIGKFPKELRQEMDEFTKNLNKNKHSLFNVPKVKEYDMVELIVEDEKYSKSGIHKGMRGCVMQDYAVKNCVEVDFSGIDKNGNFYGDCIAVKIEDLKVIKNPKNNNSEAR